MSAEARALTPFGYVARLGSLIWHAVAQLLRPPSHSRRAEAARAQARHALLLLVAASVVIVGLMFAFDTYEIGLMPPRGTPWLWPVRIVTNFGKSEYVLIALGILLALILLIAPRLRGIAHATLVGFGTRVQYIFLAVLVPVMVGELLKGVIGRGRPFVDGHANAFNFSHFSFAEAYASFPSGHATTSGALAFAVAAVWPRWRTLMIGYVVVILASRLVLLAHHPSDVIGGVIVGVLGAMIVRYWFAARSLAFTIRSDGAIDALPGPSVARLARAIGFERA